MPSRSAVLVREENTAVSSVLHEDHFSSVHSSERQPPLVIDRIKAMISVEGVRAEHPALRIRSRVSLGHSVER